MVVLVIIISGSVKEVHAYGSDGGYMTPSPQSTLNNTNNIEIQNIQVQPSTIKVGDKFTVTVTLVNNSPNPIFVERGACGAPFSVTFDNHVLVSKNNINCTLQLIVQRLDPDAKITATSPYIDLVYNATMTGNTNATVIFPYNVWDKTTQSNVEKTISKSFQFMIYDHNTGIPSLNYVEHPAMILIDSPLKQVQSGIATKNVKCNTGFQLIFKAKDNSPACVKPQTAQKLVERGWGTIVISPIQIQNQPPLSNATNYTVGQKVGVFTVSKINQYNVTGYYNSVVEKLTGARVVREQGQNLGLNGRIACRLTRNPGRLVGRFALDRGLEQNPNAPPLVLGHRSDVNPDPSSRNSHARATLQRRFSVAGEIRIASICRIDRAAMPTKCRLSCHGVPAPARRR
jgi:hypothetical protein